MKRCVFCISLFFFFSGQYSVAQSLQKTLNEWSLKNPIEKVYLHTDRQIYFAGQTIWLKSYFISGFMPTADNSTLFVELLNNQSTVIEKKVLPVFNSITYGQLELPDSLSTGNYWLRAYSPLMLNQDKSYLFTAPVRVYGKSKTIKQHLQNDTTGITIHFFPEGGNLIAGVPNTVAFKSNAADGSTVNISGIIKNTAGNTVASFATFYDGMGKFSFTPASSEQYSAIINGDTHKFALPEIVSNGIALHIKQANDSINYTLTAANNNDVFKPAFYIAQMQNRVIIKKDISTTDNKQFMDGFSTRQLPSGVLQLTFFNKDNMPLAERLLFINNKEYLLDAGIDIQKQNSGARKQNDWYLHFTDSIEGNFSIAVTDADYDIPGNRKENIISTFLLTSDVPGHINNPAWYFTGDEKTPEALDLVMLTNGWRRFKWSDVSYNRLPDPVYKDPGYISLSGKANIRSSKKNFADRDLLIWMATPNAERSLQMVKTDAQGNFKLDSVVFFNRAKILFSDVMGNKSKFITVKLNTDSLYKTYKLPNLKTTNTGTGNFNNALASKMQSAYFDYSRGEGLLLDNVAIEGRRLTEDELEKKYMSGLFLNDINARTINLTGQFISQWNIFDWLAGRLPSLRIDRLGNFGDNYRLFYRQQPVQLFLDEMPMTDASFISTIPANQIAFIKLFPQFIGARGNNAALAIYTKRGNDMDDVDATGDIIDYDGYSIIKQYYSPEYTSPPETNYKDYRLTLNWVPEITTTGGKPIPIKFYNNDRTKRFKIVVEGFTNNGKFLMIEKTIEPSK